jgi:hypothetical protein
VGDLELKDLPMLTMQLWTRPQQAASNDQPPFGGLGPQKTQEDIR